MAKYEQKMTPAKKAKLKSGPAAHKKLYAPVP